MGIRELVGGTEKLPAGDEEFKLRFLEVFSDLIRLPSYLDIAEIAIGAEDGDRNTGETYHQAVESVRDQIYGHPTANEEQKEHADRAFLLTLFASSDGAESRMVLEGFKPAAFVGKLYAKAADYQDYQGLIPLSLTSDHSIITQTDLFPDYGYTHGWHDYIPNECYDVGYLFNCGAIEKVITQNRDIFTMLGHDTSLPASEFINSVVDSNDAIAESIFKGYAPISAITFYLQCPLDLSDDCRKNYTGTIGSQSRSEKFWDSLCKLLSPEQLSLATELAADPERMRRLGILDIASRNEDFIYRTANNVKAQAVFEESGMRTYVDNMQRQLFRGSPDDMTFNYM